MKAKEIKVDKGQEDKALNGLNTSGLEYLTLKEQDKTNKIREDEISTQAKELIKELGFEDEKKNVTLDTANVSFKIECRRSPILNIEKAEKVLKRRGIYDKATKIVLDPVKIEQLHLDGSLTDADLEVFMEEKEIFAFIAKPKAKE